MTTHDDVPGPLRRLCDGHHDMIGQIRETEHWRRLVAARLDLAVAAVTGIDEPPLPPGVERDAPHGLGALLGLPVGDAALAETAVLPALRRAVTALDAQVNTLRAAAGLDLALTEEPAFDAVHERV